MQLVRGFVARNPGDRINLKSFFFVYSQISYKYYTYSMTSYTRHSIKTYVFNFQLGGGVLFGSNLYQVGQVW